MAIFNFGLDWYGGQYYSGSRPKKKGVSAASEPSEMTELTSAIVKRAATDLRWAIRRDMFMHEFSTNKTYKLIERIISDDKLWVPARQNLSAYKFYEMDLNAKEKEKLRLLKSRRKKFLKDKKKDEEGNYILTATQKTRLNELDTEIKCYTDRKPMKVDTNDIQMSTGALVSFFLSQEGRLFCGKINPMYIVKNIFAEETKGMYVKEMYNKDTKKYGEYNWVTEIYIPQFTVFCGILEKGGN